MATVRQKLAKNILIDSIVNGKPKSMGLVAKEAGFGIGIQTNPHILTNSKGWKEQMAAIDDSEILNTVVEIALDKSSKRDCIQAATLIFKIKDRFPATKIKQEVFDQRDKVIE